MDRASITAGEHDVRIRELFKSGKDTLDIAKMYDVPEALIYTRIRIGREAARAAIYVPPPRSPVIRFHPGTAIPMEPSHAV